MVHCWYIWLQCCSAMIAVKSSFVSQQGQFVNVHLRRENGGAVTTCRCSMVASLNFRRQKNSQDGSCSALCPHERTLIFMAAVWKSKLDQENPPQWTGIRSVSSRVYSYDNMSNSWLVFAAPLSLESVTAMRASAGKPFALFKYLSQVNRSGMLLQAKVPKSLPSSFFNLNVYYQCARFFPVLFGIVHSLGACFWARLAWVVEGWNCIGYCLCRRGKEASHCTMHTKVLLWSLSESQTALGPIAGCAIREMSSHKAVVWSFDETVSASSVWYDVSSVQLYFVGWYIDSMSTVVTLNSYTAMVRFILIRDLISAGDATRGNAAYTMPNHGVDNSSISNSGITEHSDTV